MSSLLLALFVAPVWAAELSPEDVARLALEHDPSLAASATEADRADLLVLGEEHRYGLGLAVDAGAEVRWPVDGREGTPDLVLGAGATVDRDFATGTDLSLYVGVDEGTPSTLDAYDLASTPPTTAVARLGLTQQLGAGRGVEAGWAARDQARASAAVADASYRESASAVVRDALTAYWELLYAEDAVHIAQEALATSVRQREEAAARVESGSLAPAELLSYETRVATLEESLLAARTDAESRAIDLQLRLGLQERPGTGDVAVPHAGGVDEGRTLEDALEWSPAVRTARASVESAQVQARTTGDVLEPSVALQTWLQAEAPVSGGTVGATQDLTAYVGLTGSLDLDRTRYRTEVERGALAVRVAERRLEAAEQAARIDVEQRLATLASAGQRLASSERTLEVASRQVEAERARVEIGAGIPIEVREAEDAAREAELRLLRARIDVVVARLAIDHLTGQLVVLADGVVL